MRSFNSLSIVTLAGLASLISLPACSDDDPPDTMGGSGGLAPATGGGQGTGATGSGATGSGATGSGGAAPVEGVPLAFSDGWLNADANTLGVQGAVFTYSDDYTATTLTETIMGPSACMSGTASKVDLNCTPNPPATDCYGEYWGAAIGFNLNQMIDPATEMGGDPMPFDMSSVTAISFNVTGATLPASSALRFTLETTAGEYCTVPAEGFGPGINTIQLDTLVTECWTGGMQTPLTAAEKSGVLKMGWQVVTNDSSEIPFDFCVDSVVAVQ